MTRQFFQFLLNLSLGLLISGCGLARQEKPSVIVVAVDFLGFDQTSCDSNIGGNGGFSQLCEGAVRFTHAYTPSTMSNASIASILTGLYPTEHKVWHNGKKFLSGNSFTVAEAAIEKGYNTAFFSGGPPVYSKSGIHQGFEVFNDSVNVELNHFYRPAKENFQLLLNWVDSEAYKEPFFSMVYLADLQFPDITTTDASNEIRSRTRQSQVAEVDESLGFLFKELKKRNRWKSTYIVLVGLNGSPDTIASKENPAYSLKTKDTLVSLFIKPPQKPRDLPINWTIDSNVSLVDLGITLFDILESTQKNGSETSFEVTSLLPVLNKPTTTWSEDRIIVTESAWPQWRGISESRFAVRKGHYLVLYDQELKVYNTLIDRKESNPLALNEPLSKELVKEIEGFFQKIGVAKWSPPDQQIIDKLFVGRQIFSKKVYGKLVKDALKLSKQRYWDDQLAGWIARYFMVSDRWKAMGSLGKKVYKPLWIYVANRNLGRSAKPPQKGCSK